MSTATKKAKKISLANNTIIFSFISILLGLLVGAIALIIAIIAIIAIARIPKQKLKQQLSDVKNPVIQSGNIDLQENTKPTGPEVQGEDIYDLNDYKDPVELLPPAVDEGDIFDEVKELQTIAKAGSAVLKAELGAFKGNIEVGLKKLGIFNEEYMRAEVLTKGYATKFAAYKYSATKDGKNYITAGRVKLVFSVPKAYIAILASFCFWTASNSALTSSTKRISKP
jgi:hypothetical protein